MGHRGPAWLGSRCGRRPARLFFPGTVNGKIAGEPVDVVFLTAEGPRYSIEDLQQRMHPVRNQARPGPLHALTPAVPSSAEASRFHLDPQAEPPREKLDRLLRHPGAAGSWNHDRPDSRTNRPAASIRASPASR